MIDIKQIEFINNNDYINEDLTIKLNSTKKKDLNNNNNYAIILMPYFHF